jgi:hypothetical protein
MASTEFLNPIRYRVSGGAAFGNQFISPRIFAAPLLESALAQVVFIVESEFFQAGPRYIGQLQLYFFRSSAGFSPFSDILCAATGSLHHLIVGTVALIHIPDRRNALSHRNRAELAESS